MAKAALFSGLRGLARDLYTFPGCHSRAHGTPDESPEDVYGACDESPRWAPDTEAALQHRVCHVPAPTELRLKVGDFSE